MKSLKARVRNGRLVLDEPTDRAEGELVELVPLDEVLAAGGDALDADEQRALHEELEASVRDAETGATVDAADVLSALRPAR